MRPSSQNATRLTDREGVELIEIALLLPPLINSRKVYDKAHQAALAEDIARDGLMLPVIVTPAGDEEGHYRVIEGWNRVEAHRLLGATAVPCEVHLALSVRDQALLNFRVNWRRQDLSELEVGLFITECIDNRLFNSKDIPAVLGQDFSGNITKLLSFGKLPAPVVRVMMAAKKKFKATVAYELLLFYKEACEVMFDEASALEATVDLAKKCVRVTSPLSAIAARRAFFSRTAPTPPERIALKLPTGRVTLSRDGKGFVRLSGRLTEEDFSQIKNFILQLGARLEQSSPQAE